MTKRRELVCTKKTFLKKNLKNFAKFTKNNSDVIFHLALNFIGCQGDSDSVALKKFFVKILAKGF